MTITAAADGSALGNPGPAGWCWFVDDEHWAAGGWPHGTNNQGELMAVIDLFETTASLPDDLLVLCDSQYVINTVTSWMSGWKRRGWRKKDGSPVLNVDLMRRLDAAVAGRRYRFEWVKGHAGHPLNEAADVRARAVATAFQTGAATTIPSGPGWPGISRGGPTPSTGAVPASVGADLPPTSAPTATRAAPERRRPVAPSTHPTLLELPTEDAEPEARDTPVIGGAAVAAEHTRMLDPACSAAERERMLTTDATVITSAGELLTGAARIAELSRVARIAHSASAALDVETVELTADVVRTSIREASRPRSVLGTAVWMRTAAGWRLCCAQFTGAIERLAGAPGRD